MKEQLKQELLDLLREKLDRQTLLYFNTCAKCGLCKEACHVYQATKNPRHVPSYRVELLRRLYRRNFTLTGKLFPFLYKTLDFDEQIIDEFYEAAYTCTSCRRCTLYCPYNIDTTWLLGIIKALVIKAGKAPETLEMLADAAIEKGKCIEDFKELTKTTLTQLEENLKKQSGLPEAEIPTDKKNSNVLYVALAGAHSILPAAIVFNKARENWTLSNFEAANYGYFMGDNEKAAAITARIVKEAINLQVKEIVISECGHAYRIFKHLYEAWTREKLPFKVSSVLEVYHRYLSEGRLQVDKSKIQEPVTYHDPCQMARNGGVIEEPRLLLKAITTKFCEMTPNGGENWCCGGGGGLAAFMELEEYRIKTGEIKAKQIAATGAKIVATPCENCRIQLCLINEKYNLGVAIISVSDLLVQTLV